MLIKKEYLSEADQKGQVVTIEITPTEILEMTGVISNTSYTENSQANEIFKKIIVIVEDFIN